MLHRGDAENNQLGVRLLTEREMLRLSREPAQSRDRRIA